MALQCVMEKKLKAGLHVILRGKTHYYNRRIPQELLDEYQPKTKVYESLKTSDLAEANSRAAKRTTELDREWFSKMALRASPVVAELTTEQIASLVHNWGVDALETDDDNRAHGFRNTAYGSDEHEVIQDLLPDSREAYALGED